MKIEVFVIGQVATNCYFLTNEETGELVIIDPAIYRERLRQKIEAEGLTLQAILLTHGHHDHMLGVADWKKLYPEIPVYAGKEEANVLKDPNLNLTYRYRQFATRLVPDVLLEDEETFSYLGTTFQYLFTPGHTEGSGCYYVREEGVLFSGDTLFAGSMGRCDLPTGNEARIFPSLRKLMTLPEETRVFPGHGESTTIGLEKKTNPYVR